jgi:hypothetical protein
MIIIITPPSTPPFGASIQVPPGAYSSSYSVAGDYVFTVPVGITSVRVVIIGAGSGGTGGGGNAGSGGTGGNAGGYLDKVLTVQPTANFSVHIGAGGAGGTSTYAGAGLMDPAAFGLSGGDTYITYLPTNTEYLADGANFASSYSPDPGSTIPLAQDSYYTTIYNTATKGLANLNGNGGNGSFGGGGGGGGAAKTGYVGLGNGGNGGDGYVVFIYQPSSIGIYYNNSGVWQQVLRPQTLLKSTSSWHDVRAGYVNVNGTWRKFFPSTGSTSFTTPGSYTWQVPPGVFSINLPLIVGAGGGGGGGSFDGDCQAGGSGGSGGYLKNQVLTVVPGENLKITVGKGGAGSIANQGQWAGPGGDTTISGSFGTVKAGGGGGGLGSLAGTYNGVGGAAGVPNGVHGHNTVNYCEDIGGSGYYLGSSNGTGYGTGGNGWCCVHNGEDGQGGYLSLSW